MIRMKSNAVLSKQGTIFSSNFPGNESNKEANKQNNMYVVVQFYPWFNFYFPLSLGMVMYDNEFETKGNKN